MAGSFQMLRYHVQLACILNTRLQPRAYPNIVNEPSQHRREEINVAMTVALSLGMSKRLLTNTYAFDIVFSFSSLHFDEASTCSLRDVFYHTQIVAAIPRSYPEADGRIAQ